METARIVQRAIDYIEERLDEPLALEAIAEAASLSVPHLYRMFYAATGHPVKSYIRKRRISEAAVLQRRTELQKVPPEGCRPVTVPKAFNVIYGETSKGMRGFHIYDPKGNMLLICTAPQRN